MLLPTTFGCFVSPMHPIGEDPRSLIEYELELVQLADRLGFDEFWVGEHHSSGWTLIGSPEVFLAAAAQLARRIKLATGVVSLPYHNPFMVAERARLLEYLTDGRFILGVGAGSYVGDMYMLGIDAGETRRRTAESTEVIVELLSGGRITRKSDWFALHEAQLQLGPLDRAGIEVVVSSAASPFGMELAGRLGVNALSHAAPPWGIVRPGRDRLGLDRLAEQWSRLEDAAEGTGTVPDRENWRLTIPVHVSDSREQALEEIYAGWVRHRQEFRIETQGLPMSRAAEASRKAFDATVEAGGIVAGTADECVEQISQLAKTCGGFGCLLISIQNWAPREAQQRSLELFARFVVPRLRGRLDPLHASQAWTVGKKTAFQEAHFAAQSRAMQGVAAGESDHR
ncbi:limonene 1,2-monooxygenase [Micromonospora luteifusca]|uniref:Limonene 1,2-monooxygenase n=1 Tax=Micromonospora luteifusca TaxID=709860 RepID=A0ABS2M2B1_9ACTN|nr:LLM class flavin-dependent oxidoreductase [Micromonospora luteifusca]MBM7494317.1 limonene 1,2-monooxygenase [Micromonospora luteifusca]